MPHAGTMQAEGIRREIPLLARFIAKLMVDALPAALASIIGGLLITYYQFNHVAASRTATEQVTPASAEMMALVRDEHAMIVDYLQTQMAAEKSRHVAEDQADARAAANARLAAEAEAAAAAAVPVPAPTMRAPAATAAAKPVAARTKVVAAATAPAAAVPPHQPLVIAQVDTTALALPPAPPAPEAKSLIAKTLDIKDNVVHATLHAVSAIGSIPSWIANRIGGGDPAASTDGQQFTTSS